MNEKHKKILEYFDEVNVEIPISVSNAIQDVFDENETVGTVEIYFREDLELFGTDLMVVKRIDISLDKHSAGEIRNTFTYFGEIDYAVSEFVNLYDERNKLIEDITNIDNTDGNTIINMDEFAVVLAEDVKWSEGELSREATLYIYCPENID